MLLTDNQHHRPAAQTSPEINLLAASSRLSPHEAQFYMQRGRRLRAEAMQHFGKRVGHALGALASRTAAGLRRWREVRETETALRNLSTATLRDIGIEPDQIASIARGMSPSRREAARGSAQVQQLRPQATQRDDCGLYKAAA